MVLSDFGKYHQQEITLAPGLNIVTGANESGKTTLRRFIRSMFYGLERERGIRARKDDYTRFKPWEYGRFQGILEFQADKKEYRLFRNFLTTEKEVVLTELSTGRELEQPERVLQSLGLKPESVYTNTFWVGNVCTTEELLGTELREYLAGLAYSGGTGLNLQKSLDWLAARKKELLKQVPEQELAECLEQMEKKNGLQVQIEQLRSGLAVMLEQQNTLEAAIRAEKEATGKLTEEYKQAEAEERRRRKKEHLALVCFALTAVFGGAAFLLPLWQCRLFAAGIAVSAAVCGAFFGITGIRGTNQRKERKQELEERLLQAPLQLEKYYQKLTGLAPEIEKKRLWAEKTEEALQQCERLEERYAHLRQKKQELLREAEAVGIAAQTLEQIASELYEEFSARFATALSGYAGAFTDQAYQRLTADENLRLKAVTDKKNLDITEVSFGTGEQFYLALRFAAADVFDPEKKNTVILDDSFAAFDDQRLESAILTLAKCGRQILILSSSGREEAAAKRMGISYEKVF